MDMKPICRTPMILALAHLSLTILGGCAVVDKYSSRAIEYNEQTAASKNSIALLNILRAAYREPLQFTDISTVTGTASAQGSLSADIPLLIGGTNFMMPQLLNLNPSATVSGGPNFSVANLSTQEFYQGLQSSIDTQVIANYVAAGVSRNLLLPLLISEIKLDEPEKIRILRNTGSTEISSYYFRFAIAQLVKNGFDIEGPKTVDEHIGPVLTREQASDATLLAGVAQANKDLSLSLQAKNSANGKESTSEFILSKPSKKTYYCFWSKKTPFPDTDYTELSKRQGFRPISLTFPGYLDLTIRVPPCGVAGRSENATFTIRSVEQIFLFLGEIVRTELGLNAGEPNAAADQEALTLAKYNDPANPIPRELFRVEQRMPVNGEISANFHGTYYTVATDPSGADASSQVLAILTDLLALQSSAKSLPAPNVIAVAP